MKVPPTSRVTHTFSDRAAALGHFFQRAGEAPRLVAFDDEVGCPLHNALAALEWTIAVGILDESDHIHAARLSGETAAAMVERQRDVVHVVGPEIQGVRACLVHASRENHYGQ